MHLSVAFIESQPNERRAERIHARLTSRCMGSWEIHPSSSRLLNFLARLLVGIYICCSPALFLPFFIAPASSSQQQFIQWEHDCTPFTEFCGDHELRIEFPFSWKGGRENCAYDKEFEIYCNSTDNSLGIEIQSRKFHIKSIDNFHHSAIIAEEQPSKKTNHLCMLPARTGTNLNIGPFHLSNKQNVNITLFYNCSLPPPDDDKNGSRAHFKSLQCLSNEGASIYAYFALSPYPSDREPHKGCESMEIPIQKKGLDRLLGEKPEDAWNSVLSEGFAVSWANINQNCKECIQSEGICFPNRTSPQHPFCWCEDERTGVYIDACPGKNSPKKKYIAGFAGGGGGALICIAFIIWCFRKKLHISASSKPLARAISYDPSLNSDIENSGFLHVTQCFDYRELKEVTNNFDSSKELGDGGFKYFVFSYHAYNCLYHRLV